MASNLIKRLLRRLAPKTTKNLHRSNLRVEELERREVPAN